MRKIAFCAFISVSAFARLVSPFPSTVSGVSLYNSHIVVGTEDAPVVVRGMQPFKPEHFSELKDFGVDRVIMAMTGDDDKFAPEREGFERVGIGPDRLEHKPLPYFGFKTFAEPCETVVDILQTIKKSRKNRETVLLHCTVGEDRTGLVSGLLMMLEEGTSARRAFRHMCRNGYSSGNPRKPEEVVSRIDSDLTPLYLKMAWLIESGRLSWKRLDKKACALLDKPVARRASPSSRAKKFRCSASELYDPSITE